MRTKRQTPFDMNRPGALQEIRPVDVRVVNRLRITAVHLVFTSRDGRRCAVYAAMAVPKGREPHPLVIHVPGGGQTVHDDDLAFWVGHGFACVAFDWQVGLFNHDPARKSGWPAGVVLQAEPFERWSQFIIPLAVEAVGVVIDWATKDRRIASDRIGITGISWGGYLTWVANAYEPRLKAVVPVYGCGGLFDPAHACRMPVSGEVAKRWASDWDPLTLAGRQLSPVCWLSATNDFFGWWRHGDAVLNAMRLPHRRAHHPNNSHIVQPEDAATAVAWMKHYLAGGPALPAEPQWTGKGLKVDRPGEVASVEEWWTPSDGADDLRCWVPGAAPAEARARLAHVCYRAGYALTTSVQVLKPGQRLGAAAGDLWTDARAGLGYCSMVESGTQLHGKKARVVPLPGDPSRVRVLGHNAAIMLRHFADPRFNRPGFAGLRLRLTTTATPVPKVNICLNYQTAGRKPERREVRGTAPVAADGTVELSRRTMPFLPPDVAWATVLFIWIDGFPFSDFVLGSIQRIKGKT